MPGLIDIAGAGIRPPKPLPADIQVNLKAVKILSSANVKYL